METGTLADELEATLRAWKPPAVRSEKELDWGGARARSGLPSSTHPRDQR